LGNSELACNVRKVQLLAPIIMKTKPLAIRKAIPVGIATLLTTFSFNAPTLAENLEHTQRLLSTRQCAGCELSNAGLTYAKLTNANLSRANLSGANLSRADLQGADLRGANLVGASLFGANLAGAKLDSANLVAADLRWSYLVGTSFDGAVTENVFLQGAVGIPVNLGKAEEFYRWALEDAKRGDHPAAIENFTQTLSRKPDFAAAYLGRAVSRVQAGDKLGAVEDSQKAEQLFKQQGNTKGTEVAQAMFKELTTPPAQPKKGNGFGQALLGVIGGILQLLPLFAL
jgi:uncharacterized protein YjbI with pentapeptide repeats